MSEADSYDYIIVGAGSAGCVLANRLSADPANRVCLIEAGGKDRHPLIQVPLAVIKLMQHKVLNWRFDTVAQKNASNRPIYIPRGKVVGGSSSINGMVYMRGNRLDYDDWSNAGCEGWSYAEVLPYFKRSENNEVWGGSSPYHGKGGVMNVTDAESYTPLAEMLFEAASQLQLPRTEDFNGKQQEGFGRRQFTVKGGRRESTSTAFLRPALSRKNLTLVTDCVVDKVTLAGKRATGVEILTASGKRTLTARKEVIVSGGAIHSPTVLLRSGIGPAAELAKLGIAVQHDLPGVGKNLQDHILTSLQHKTESRVPYGISLDKLPWVAAQVLKYAFARRGLLANPMLHVGGFVKTEPGLDRPDIQFILLPAYRTPGGATGIGHGYGLSILLLRPKSRGFVTVRSTDPTAAPVIDPHFLEEDEDMALLIKGFRLGRRLLESSAWDKVRGPETKPGPDTQTDEQVKQYIRDWTATAFHPVGTCKMGKDPMAVVDPQLRVHGIEGLRVADASIMPTLIGGNTNAPAIMIGEKCADMVLGKAPLPAAAGV